MCIYYFISLRWYATLHLQSRSLPLVVSLTVAPPRSFLAVNVIVQIKILDKSPLNKLGKQDLTPAVFVNLRKLRLHIVHGTDPLKCNRSRWRSLLMVFDIVYQKIAHYYLLYSVFYVLRGEFFDRNSPVLISIDSIYSPASIGWDIEELCLPWECLIVLKELSQSFQEQSELAKLKIVIFLASLCLLSNFYNSWTDN